MDLIRDCSCLEFSRQLASAAPTPGGGGASALAGALGAALGGMVAELTRGKNKYAAVRDDIERLACQAEMLREQLLDLVRQDAEAFEPLAAAYRLPGATVEEKAQKAAVMEKALYGACLPPLEIMRVSCRVLDVLDELAQKGSALARSDAGVGAALCRAALQGAVLNVLINAGSMEDREKAEALREEAAHLLNSGTRHADEIYEAVTRDVNGGRLL